MVRWVGNDEVCDNTEGQQCLLCAQEAEANKPRRGFKKHSSFEWGGGGRPLNSCLVLEPSSSLGLKHVGQFIHLYHLLCLSRHQYFLLRHEEQPLTMPLDASSSDQSTPNGWSIDRVPLLLP